MATSILKQPIESILLKPGAGSHNTFYRGDCLGAGNISNNSDPSVVTDAQWAAINTGTFNDMFIGDYWTINGINWRIAAFDYWRNAYPTPAHHVVIVPDSILSSARMNPANDTSGGYYGSEFRTGNNGNTARASAISAVNTAFGSNHILEYHDFLSSNISIDTTNGQATVIGVRDEVCTVELMNEFMVFGCRMVGEEVQKLGENPVQEYTISMTQLPLFRLDREHIITYPRREQWYLRDVTGSNRYACVLMQGEASHVTQHVERGIRPVFGIYQA